MLISRTNSWSPQPINNISVAFKWCAKRKKNKAEEHYSPSWHNELNVTTRCQVVLLLDLIWSFLMHSLSTFVWKKSCGVAKLNAPQNDMCVCCVFKAHHIWQAIWCAPCQNLWDWYLNVKQSGSLIEQWNSETSTVNQRMNTLNVNNWTCLNNLQKHLYAKFAQILAAMGEVYSTKKADKTPEKTKSIIAINLYRFWVGNLIFKEVFLWTTQNAYE